MKNKRIVITGGSGAIGKALAKELLAKGAMVLITDLKDTDLEKTKEELASEKLFIYKADVSQENEVLKYVQYAVEKMGGIDIFYNNAGVEGKVAPLDEYPLEVFDQVLNVNIKGVFYGLRHVFPVMKNNKEGGSIVITSSVAGLMGTPNVLPYVTSKHAVIGMMKSAALEGAPHKIRVNTVNPSPVDNRMMRSLEEGFAPGAGAEAKKGFEQSIPLQRYATNEDVAKLMLFLGSDESSFITGTVNPVDGGMTA
ncbi:SDR family NAD(P)-dependent oxidoreductase [Marivirga harenae]|uniref:SDR family NAD(P)-dependent oxidoreductase n=1 Tax=Marivirga harenae TaxID=2010992 RepID=UPI0026DF0B72|nr:SDR family NAD(P)-dependent oxidoreductase [Marivirga harenae]WKV13556.1 SDR family NAD(P)-dependent oxidoreductase [Marivirga harenae]|tara:strand:- start:196908 stop:197666 length:759 start_codon:yes stop_codon:yes gene_type:complete